MEGANTYYYHNDHLGTPQKMTDSAGVVVWSADYKPFGEATITVSTITNSLRFPGQYFDAETGNHYNYARDYDPVIGKYKESDPIGLDGGINLYSYALNNSIRFTDPSGLKVYRCCRDLKVNAVVNWAASQLGEKHCFIQTGSRAGGMGPATGDNEPSCPIGIQTKITDHSGEGAGCTACHNGQAGFATCTEVPDVDEACVNNELENKKTGRWWPWNNCNTVADDILKKCKKIQPLSCH